MKKKRFLKTVCVLVLACLVLTLCSCSSTKDYPEKIIGEWQLSDWNPERAEKYFSSFLVLSEGGVCDGEFDNRVSWRLSENVLELISADSTIRYIISSLGKDKLTISWTRDGETYKAEYTKVS